jgi:hypothetical protein
MLNNRENLHAEKIRREVKGQPKLKDIRTMGLREAMDEHQHREVRRPTVPSFRDRGAVHEP